MSIVRVILVGRIVGQLVENVLHFDNVDSLMTPQQIANEVITNWILTFKSVQNVGLVYTDVLVQTLTPAPSIVERFPTGGITGELAGNAYSPAVCPLVTIQSAVSGRRGHGRFYIYGLHGDSVVNGGWHPGAFVLYAQKVNFIELRYGPAGGAGLKLGVCSRGNPGDWKQMVHLVLRPTFGIQRRRNLGVGQ